MATSVADRRRSRASFTRTRARARLRDSQPLFASNQPLWLRIWLATRLTQWPLGEFVGTLAVEPVSVRDFSKGQLMRVLNAGVFDHSFVSTTDGVIEMPPTDILLMDFVLPLPS